MKVGSAIDRRRKILAPGINLTPLLDAILNLTFFFLVATTIKKHDAALQVNLPASQTASAMVKYDTPSVTLDARGKIHYQDRELGEEEFAEQMRALSAGGTGEIDIRGDRTVDFGHVVHLMDICKRAGLRAANWVAVGENPPR